MSTLSPRTSPPPPAWPDDHSDGDTSTEVLFRGDRPRGVAAFDQLVAAFLRTPDRTRLTFLGGESGDVSVTGGELIQRAVELSERLIPLARPGDRIMVAFPAGIEFVVALLASVRAGLVPVPVPYPKPRRPASRYAAIVTDCGARWGITDAATLQRIEPPQTGDVGWLSPGIDAVIRPGVEDHDPDFGGPEIDGPEILGPGNCTPDPGRDDANEPPPLFLQYTSGSTSSPKGVRVTLDNLMANLRVIADGFGLDSLPVDRRVVCSWLPAYHDMGLVGVILSTLVHDGHAVLMSPASFLQQPARWIRAISDHRATITVAPAFGYQWATSKINDDELAGIDLASLGVAACGAEPIDPSILQAFGDKFRPHGFKPNVFYPCYGLAESTLMVTGADRGQPVDRNLGNHDPTSELPGAKVLSVDRAALQHGRAEIADAASPDDAHAIDLCSCGPPGRETTVVIVDPTTHAAVDDHTVGEIWVDSPSVAAGYHGDADLSESTFAAQLTNSHSTERDEFYAGDRRTGFPRTGFLRTGDLGFLHDGELYVTGRLKELMIIRGQNHYPRDIERSVAACDDRLVDAMAAAFSISRDGNEHLILVQELPRGYDKDQTSGLLNQIRLAIAASHDLIADEIVLVRAASMPRTSSGKVQRLRCRELWQADDLKVVDRWQTTTDLDPSHFPDLSPLRTAPDPYAATASRIERVLVAWLSRQTGGQSIDAEQPFAECGIDSLMAVEMSSQLERWLGVQLSPVIAWSYPNARKLSHYLTDQVIGEQEPDASAADDVASQPSLESLLHEIESMDDEQAAAMLAQLDEPPSDAPA